MFATAGKGGGKSSVATVATELVLLAFDLLLLAFDFLFPCEDFFSAAVRLCAFLRCFLVAI
jgi:hypothetical protein